MCEHLRAIEGAPSVAMKETPRIYNVDRKEEEEDPEAREDSRGEEER